MVAFKDGFISENFSLWIKSKKKERCQIMTSAQNGDLTHFFEDLNQIEKLSEIKPTLQR